MSEHHLTVVRAASALEWKQQNNAEPWPPLCHVIFWKHSVTGEVSRARGRRGFNGTRNYTNRIYPVNLLTASQRRRHPTYNEPWNLPEIADCVLMGTAYGCSSTTGKVLWLQVMHTSSTISHHWAYDGRPILQHHAASYQRVSRRKTCLRDRLSLAACLLTADN